MIARETRPVARTVGPSPKMLGGTAGGLAVGLALAALQGGDDGAGILPWIPQPWASVLLIFVPTLVALLTTWAPPPGVVVRRYPSGTIVTDDEAPGPDPAGPPARDY